MSQILVVDDTAECREPIARLLRLEGHRVQCAANGLEALGSIQKIRPDLVVLDMMMPVMDGLTFLSVLRAHQDFKDMPVIILTALWDSGYIAKAQELGVKGYFVKASSSPDELLSQIHEYAGKH